MTPPRVLMLGWEFPPFITGGLGTACHGLTRGLTSAGCDITFALPRAISRSHSSHVRLLSPVSEVAEVSAWVAPPEGTITESTDLSEILESTRIASIEKVRTESLQRGTPERIKILDLPMMAQSSYASGSARGRLITTPRDALKEIGGIDGLGEELQSLTDEQFEHVIETVTHRRLSGK